jgi:hypothetical protein
MILKIVTCDICGESYRELKYGEGFPGWGQLHGIALDGVPDPYFCPEHLAEISDFVCQLKENKNG